MNLYKNNNSIVLNKDEKCFNIQDENNYNLWITGDKSSKLSGKSFKITEYDRKIYYIFREFYLSLLDQYNAYKDFNDYKYEDCPLYDEEHNWFTFYDDYSNVNDGNFFRIIKNETKEPYTIGIYIQNKNNRLQSHIVAKSGSRYQEFIGCFSNLINELNKLEKDKIYQKKKEV